VDNPNAPKQIVHNNEKTFLQHKMNYFNDESDPFPYYPNPDEDSGYYVSQTGMYLLKTYDFTTWTANGGERYREYKFGDSPYQYVMGESDELARSRRYHIKQAMSHAWHGYEAQAFGKDELLPQSGRGNNKWGGMGMTLVDALDTLWLMDLKDEFARARDWCATTLQHDLNTPVSTFETTIRSLGGLLSAYDWSGDDIFLTQAKDLGQRLFKAFDPKNPGALPHGQVNLSNGGASNIGWTANSVILSEITTIQLEFRYLARLSGIHDYKTKTEHVFEVLHAMQPPNGLYPYFLKQGGGKNGALPTFVNQKITFGAMSDSCYEYMLKLWLQGGKTEPLYREMYDTSIQGMHDELVSVSTPSGLVFLADKNSGRMDYKMDHLVCFMGGLLALGAYTDPLGLESDRAQRDLKTAKALTYTCYQMYARMPTGISPEYVQFQWGKDFRPGRDAPHYLLRPETVESFFVLYHLTKDPIYREWGWEVFSAIERYCKTKYGYGELSDVRRIDQAPRDKMESFFLAETLKYLYLLFDPDTPIDLLHKHVFNTEAHPVRIMPVLDQEGVVDLLQ